MNPKVLIAGAGPVGMTLAIELARFGVPVRIVDKAPARTDKSKALAIWSRTLELFDRAGLAAPLVAAGTHVTAANVFVGARRIAHVALDTLDTDYAYALMVPQYDTERILETHLQSLGVTVGRDIELVQFADTGSGIRASLRHGDGASEEVEADWLVGCDGAHSVVRHGLGKNFDGDTIEDEFILADLRIAGDGLPVDEVAAYWHAKGVVIFFPMPGNRFRLVASVEPGAGATATEPTLAEVQGIIDERVPGRLTASDPVWIARFRINERKVADYRSGRVFLAGDAAHIHSPAGGQGMNTGMQDAFNLAWKLALVCDGACGDDLLASYSPERGAVAEKVIAESGRLTKVATLSNHFEQAARNFVAGHLFGLQSVRHAAAETLSELAIGYDASPLNGGHPCGVDGPLPGQRLSPRGRPPIGADAAPRFAVFAADPDDGSAAVLERHARLLEGAVRPAVAPGGIWLVRPDGYVAMIASAGDWRAVGDYLDGLAVGEPSVAS